MVTLVCYAYCGLFLLVLITSVCHLLPPSPATPTGELLWRLRVLAAASMAVALGPARASRGQARGQNGHCFHGQHRILGEDRTGDTHSLRTQASNARTRTHTHFLLLSFCSVTLFFQSFCLLVGQSASTCFCPSHSTDVRIHSLTDNHLRDNSIYDKDN